MQYECGCVNDIHEGTGAMFAVLKYAEHQKMRIEQKDLDESYYQPLGLLNHPAGVPPHVAEFEDSFGALGPAPGHASALEIGGGASPYVPMLTKAGYRYYGVEPSTWAADWVRKTYSQDVGHIWTDSWEDAQVGPGRLFSLILSAHSLEHMADAPAAVVKMAQHLTPGGQLYIVVPDDTDLSNPDHMWFINRASLATVVSRAGSTVCDIVEKRRVEKESFIYRKAVRG